MDDEVPEHRDTHASFLMKYLQNPHPSEVLGKHSVYTLCLKTEIARSVGGQKLQGPHAEDAMTGPHLVHKILVI